MELMPHIKALLDDLIKMTNHIVVKRTDLANRYENNNNTLHLYQQSAEILDGVSTFYTYPKYFKSVLRQYGKWNKTESTDGFGALEPLIDSNNKYNKMTGNQVMTMSKNAPDKKNSIGSGWVKYIGNGSFPLVYNFEASQRTVNLSIVGIENNIPNINNEIPSIIFDGSDISSIKNRTLYIHDEEYNSYIPVIIRFISEYISTNDHIKDDSFIYLKDDSENDLIFVDNTEKYGDKIIKNSIKINGSPIMDNDDKDEYYFRYKVELHYSDDRYYDRIKYFQPNQIIDNSIYAREDAMHYYSTENGYLPLYKKDKNGSYIYDTSVDQFINIEDEDELLLINENDLYIKMEDVDDSNIFYRYYDSNASMIEQSTFRFNNIDFERYEINDNNDIKLFYNYSTEDDEVTECSIYVYQSSINDNWTSYKTYDGDYNLIETDLKLYYFYENPNGLYIRNINDFGTYVYIKTATNDISTKKYDFAESIEGTHGFSYDTCTYTNPDVEYYIYERALTDRQISLYSSNRNNIPSYPENLRNDLKLMMDEHILNIYCTDRNSEDYSVPLYRGETNKYYRELNGLPALSESFAHPRINRLTINPNYSGTYTNPYLFELSDSEIETIESLGLLDKYKSSYPKLLYLNYLGKNRIDVIKARQASPYDILRIDDSEMILTKNMFMENYNISKNYIFKKYYKPDMFGMQEYYHAYIGFLICILTMIMCITKSGEILIQNKFMDQSTVDLILESYGFKGTFDSIPLIYRREIAKSIIKLIRNKGIDSIYEEVYKLFNIEDIEVYKYFFRKVFNRDTNGNLSYINGEPDYDITISQVPISSANIVKDIINDSNKLNYDDITSIDRYWGVYESDESIKEQIKKLTFNYMNSKYITLNNKFNLTELNFNSAYLLNYLLDSTRLNGTSINIDIDEMENPQSLENLLIMLFAIQSIKYGFDGNIPNDIISAASIYKFNLDETVVTDIDGSAGKAKKIIDYYLDYMTQDAASSVLSLNDSINNIKNENQLHDSVKGTIYNNKYDNTVTSLSSTYLKNIENDNSLTITDESSIYQKLLYLREHANTMTDFRCFDELLKCISICKETDKVYKLPNPIWECMYECMYDSNKDKIENSETTHYIDVINNWKIKSTTEKVSFISNIDNPELCYRLADDRYVSSTTPGYTFKDGKLYYNDPVDGEIEVELHDINLYYAHFNLPDNYLDTIKITTLKPGINDFDKNIKYVVCINDISRKELMEVNDLTNSEILSRIDVYEKISIFDELQMNRYINILYESINQSSIDKLPILSKEIGINNYAYIGNEVLDTFISDRYNLTGPILYVEVVPNYELSDVRYSVKIYRKCDSALTYSMYLRECAPELYNYLNFKSGETNSDYEERLNKFSSTIIATIENNIEASSIKEQIKLSYVDFSNISKYIKLIINVFKSYSIDLSSMDIIYNIDDKDNNRVKIIDDIYSNETYGIDSNIHISSSLSSEDEIHIKELMKIKDEIYIEYYARQSYDVDPNDIDTYYLINNTNFSTNDYKISAYWYGRSLEQKFHTYKEMDSLIIGKSN